jgi:hypothetical protein
LPRSKSVKPFRNNNLANEKNRGVNFVIDRAAKGIGILKR